MLLRRLLIFGVIAVALTFWLQRKLMYPATQVASLAAKDFPQLRQFFTEVSDVELKTADGITIRGWHLQSKAERADFVFVLFHGNGGHRGHRGFWYEVIRSLDADVLAIDYHGYGDSAGQPSEKALHQDARAAWDHVIRRGYRPDQIIVAGESLGGGVAVQLAAEKCKEGNAPHALILLATFDSMLNAACSNFPWLPVKWVLLDRYHSDQAIGKVTCPIMQFHGDRDDIVPLPLAKRLQELTPPKSLSGRERKFRVFEGAGHNNLLRDFARDIRDDIAELLNLPRKYSTSPAGEPASDRKPSVP